MKKSKKILLCGILGILLVMGVLIFEKTSIKGTEVTQVESLIAQQEKVEQGLSSSGYTFWNPYVIVNPYGNSPLTALVMFETESEVEVTVTIPGKDELSTFTHTFEASKEHYLPIYGLYAGVMNDIILSYQDSDIIKEKHIAIQTEALPSDMVVPTEVYANQEKLSNALYFYTPSSIGYTCAYDVNGDIRWYFNHYALWKIDRLKNGHLLLSTERLMNTPYYTTGLYEMDLLGKIYVEYSLKGGYHHDYYEMENGNLLVASDDFLNDSGTVEDYIVELDRKTGEIVKTFDLKDILRMEDGKSENWINYDWFHNNSVWYDQKTNSITLSGRHQDAVINIDYDSGALNWILGDSTNWSEEYQKYFFQPVSGSEFEWQWSQHAAMITPEGYVFLLDNGNNKSKLPEEYVDASSSYTRGVMYKIDTENMTIEQVWQYGKERGSSFYSPYISDVDYIEPGHYIVHSGGIVYVDGKNSNQPAGFSKNATLVSDTVELLDDEIIFELKLPTNNYRVEKMPLYTENEQFSIVKAKRIGSLGKTEFTQKKSSLLLHTTKIDEEYLRHDISIAKEVDRLVVKGTFQKGTLVNVVLSKGLVSKVYPVVVSKKPYTALCVDVFTEEETKNGILVTKYIHEEGLEGKYSIALSIDGVLYDTSTYVEF